MVIACFMGIGPSLDCNMSISKAGGRSVFCMSISDAGAGVDGHMSTVHERLRTDLHYHISISKAG